MNVIQNKMKNCRAYTIFYHLLDGAYILLDVIILFTVYDWYLSGPHSFDTSIFMIWLLNNSNYYSTHIHIVK